MGVQGNTSSANWWERAEVDSEEVFEYMSSADGQKLLDQFYGVKSGLFMSNFLGNWSVRMGGDLDLSDLSVDSFFLDIDSGNSAIDNAEVNNRLQQIMNKLNEICQKLDAIQNEIKKVENQVYLLQQWAVVEDLVHATSSVQGFLVEVATLSGVDYTYRAQMIMDYILKGYETRLLDAFNSGLNRVALMNSYAEKTRKIPIKMLLEDIYIIRQMSLLRLTFVPSVFHGNDLLKYRANVAKVDLARALELKASINAVFNLANSDRDYLIETFSQVVSWEVVLRAHMGETTEIVHFTIDGRDGVITGTNIAVVLDYGSNLADLVATYATTGQTVTVNGVVQESGVTHNSFTSPVVYHVVGEDGSYKNNTVNVTINSTYPSYWSRCESIDNLTSAQIATCGPYISGSIAGVMPLDGWQYGNMISQSGSFDNYGPFSGTIYPHGNMPGYDNGAISYWSNTLGNASINMINGNLQIQQAGGVYNVITYSIFRTFKQ